MKICYYKDYPFGGQVHTSVWSTPEGVVNNERYGDHIYFIEEEEN